MKKEDIDVYIITNSDENLNSGEHNKRVLRISGFSGSSGFAIVTKTKAALSTDSRYFEQAEDELDCQWILLRNAVPGYPSPYNWILEESVQNNTVALSEKSTTKASFDAYKKSLQDRNVVSIEDDLVERNWTNKPDFPDNPLFVHEFEYTGRYHSDKVKSVRQSIGSGETRIVTDLPEIACN